MSCFIIIPHKQKCIYIYIYMVLGITWIYRIYIYIYMYHELGIPIVKQSRIWLIFATLPFEVIFQPRDQWLRTIWYAPVVYKYLEYQKRKNDAHTHTHTYIYNIYIYGLYIACCICRYNVLRWCTGYTWLTTTGLQRPRSKTTPQESCGFSGTPNVD